MLLQPPFFAWTLDLLSSSRITTLMIASRVTLRETWSAFLCSVTIVQLKFLYLDFSTNRMEFTPVFVDLENFFARHPRIHTLQLRSAMTWPQASTFTEAVLPYLSSLAGHPIYVRSFLQMQQSHYSISNLSYLCPCMASRVLPSTDTPSTQL